MISLQLHVLLAANNSIHRSAEWMRFFGGVEFTAWMKYRLDGWLKDSDALDCCDCGGWHGE
jgi:hypothetical protein